LGLLLAVCQILGARLPVSGLSLALPVALPAPFVPAFSIEVDGTDLPDTEPLSGGAVDVERKPEPLAGHLERLERDRRRQLSRLVGWHPRRTQLNLAEQNLLAPFRLIGVGLDVKKNPQVLGTGIVIRQNDAIPIEQQPLNVPETDAVDGGPIDGLCHAGAPRRLA
jgi:hypothetical protein